MQKPKYDKCEPQKKMVKDHISGKMIPISFHTLIRKTEDDGTVVLSCPHERWVVSRPGEKIEKISSN